MLLTLTEMARTNIIETSAPTKAAITSETAPGFLPPDKKKIRASATVNFAPDEIPSTKGPTMGLLKNVCNIYPERASAPPKITAAIILGTLIFIITLASMVPVVLPAITDKISAG